MVKIMVLASFNMDLVMRADRRPEAGETIRGEFAMHLGGKGFNQAVAARRLGADVSVIGRVGDDEFGRMFLDALDHEGIDRRHVTIDPHEGTGVAQIVVEPDGANTIIQAPRANLAIREEIGVLEYEYDELLAQGVSDEELESKSLDAALCQLETSFDAIGSFTFAVDVLGCEWKILNAAPACAVPVGILPRFNLLVVNAREAGAMTNIRVETPEDATRAASHIARLGLSTTAVTLGERGAVVVRNGDATYHPAFGVEPIDTTGAGDAFCAALAVKLSEGADSFEDALRFANAAGAVACTRHGAYPSMPHRHEVEALLAAQGAPS